MNKNDRSRIPGGLVLAPLCILLIASVIGCWCATEYVAEGFADQQQLGVPWCWIAGHAVYQPFAYFVWLNRWNAYAPHRFDMALFWIYGVVLAGLLVAILFNVWRARGNKVVTTYGSARWADRADVERSGLIGRGSVVLGLTEQGEYLTHDGPEHIEVTAPSRSGKGVGIVVPTLLSWRGSVIVNDIKGENWTLTSGYRRRFGYVLAFNPTSRETCRFNPLMEIRPGDNEVRDAQNVCDMIVDPEGKGKPDHWSKEADAWLLAVILHVLYAEPDKTLGGVARFLNDPDRTIHESLEGMLVTPHLPSGPHPVVAIGARAMLNKSANERSGVHSTARSFFSLYLDPVVAASVSESDFRIADLMQADYPLSLYLMSPPSDKARLRPLFRLLLNQCCRRLTEELNPPANKHRLLLLPDEFPSLGRLDFFEDTLGFIAGYGIKVLMISQSVNQIVKFYGPHNTVMDGAHVHVYFAPNTEETAKKISDLLGTKTEIHTQEGTRLDTKKTLTPIARQQLIHIVAHAVGVTVDENNPSFPAELPESGYRFHAIVPPQSPDGPTFVIRKKPTRVFSLDEYVAADIMSAEHAAYIRQAVRNRENILVGGSTGSGKTTLTNAILKEIGRAAGRVLTVEDTMELQVEADEVVRQRTVRIGDTVRRSMQDIVRDMLRLSPDRIVVGEVRGPEAIDLIQGWNTGHPGGVATIHCNSAPDALERMEDLLLQGGFTPVPRQIAKAVNVVLFVGTAIADTQHGKRSVRRLLDVARVVGVQLTELGHRYVFEHPFANAA